MHKAHEHEHHSYCRFSIDGFGLSHTFHIFSSQLQDRRGGDISDIERLDHHIRHLPCPHLIVRFTAAVGGGCVRPAKLLDESVVSGIVDDPPGAAVGEDKRRTAGTADSVVMTYRDTGASLQRPQGGESGDVAFVGGATFDGIKPLGTLGDEANGGVGGSEVDGRSW